MGLGGLRGSIVVAKLQMMTQSAILSIKTDLDMFMFEFCSFGMLFKK